MKTVSIPFTNEPQNWNKDVDDFTADMKAKTSNVDWHAVDTYRLTSLYKLLRQSSLLLPDPNSPESTTTQPGSLFTDPQLVKLNSIWSRLPPWDDTKAGLSLLNKTFITATLSNTHEANMRAIVDHSSLPFQHVFTSSMFNSYKPNAKVYQGAAEKLGFQPEECALVAAHLGDLKGAKDAGFGMAIYVERELEEKEPELVGQGIPDLVVEEGSGGFVKLAEILGVKKD
jgi:2-haloacid dehalogenase